MGYIKYRFVPMVKPAIKLLVILCGIGFYFMGAHYFTNYIWVPSFDEPLNNRFDDFGFYYTVDTRYENGYMFYLLGTIGVFVITKDYNDYRKIATSEDE